MIVPALDRLRDLCADLISLLESEELLSLAVLTGLLLFIRQRFIPSRPAMQQLINRIGLMAFVLYFGRAVVMHGVAYSGELIQALLRSGIAAGIAIGVCSIVAPILDVLYDRSVGAMFRTVGAWRQRQVNRRRGRQEAEANRQLALQQQREQVLRDERQRKQQRAAQIRQQQQAQEAADREQLRFDCQLLHDQLYPELRDRFPRKRLAEYFETFMNDSQPLPDVQDRAERLRKMLLECVNSTTDAKKQFTSLDKLQQHFEEMKNDVAASTIADEAKSAAIAQINFEEDRSIQEFLA